MLRRICAGGPGALLLLAAAPLSPRAAFPTPGPLGRGVIEKAEEYGLMEGYPDGTFGVEDEITRGSSSPSCAACSAGS